MAKNGYKWQESREKVFYLAYIKELSSVPWHFCQNYDFEKPCSDCTEGISLPGIFYLAVWAWLCQSMALLNEKHGLLENKVGAWDQESTLVDNCHVILGRKERVCNFTF